MEVAPEGVDYCDSGFTGANGDRPKLKQLLRDIRPGDRVFTLKLDRLARNLRLLLDIEAQLQAKGVPLNSISENVDTSTPFGRMTFQILGVVAEWEKAIIVEHTRSGRLARYKQGKWAAGKPLYGYRYNRDNGMLDIEETEAGVVRRIFGHYVYDRLGCLQIAQQLNEEGVPPRRHGKRWHKSTIWEIITHPGYKGEHPRGVVSPAIVTPTLWQLAQKRTKDNGHLHRREGLPYLLQGMITCGQCGLTLACTRSHDRNGRRIYVCRGRWRGTKANGDHRCDLPIINAGWLEDAVWQTLEGALENPARLSELLSQSIEDMEKRVNRLEDSQQPVEKQLADVRERQERLADEWVVSKLSEARWQELKSASDKEEQRLLQLKQQQDPAQLQELSEARAKLEVWREASKHLSEGGKLWPPGAWLLGEYASKDTIDFTGELSVKAKRAVLDRLQVHLYAYYNRIELRGLLPLPTIESQGFESSYRHRANPL